MVRRWVVAALAGLMAVAGLGVERSVAGPSGAAACDGSRWVAAWAASMQGAGGPLSSSMTGHSFAPPGDTFSDQTLRQIAHLHFGGTQVRITLSNLFGTQPLRIGETHVAIRAADAAIEVESDRAVTFAGAPAVTIAAGEEAVSDPTPLAVTPFSDLAVSIYTPEPHRAGHAARQRRADLLHRGGQPDRRP